MKAFKLYTFSHTCLHNLNKENQHDTTLRNAVKTETLGKSETCRLWSNDRNYNTPKYVCAKCQKIIGLAVTYILDRQKAIITNVSVTVGNVKYYSFCPLSLMLVLRIYKTIPWKFENRKRIPWFESLIIWASLWYQLLILKDTPL